MEAGTWVIFNWNGKDLFLQNPMNHEDFTVMTFSEIPNEYHPLLKPGREVEVFANGDMRLKRTPEEIEADRIRNLYRVNLERDIAALEAGGENNLPVYALNKLKLLRKEIAELQPTDPTAITLEQQRANASLTRKDFLLKNGREKLKS